MGIFLYPETIKSRDGQLEAYQIEIVRPVKHFFTIEEVIEQRNKLMLDLKEASNDIGVIISGNCSIWSYGMLLVSLIEAGFPWIAFFDATLCKYIKIFPASESGNILDFSITETNGKAIALIGPPHSGKSTIASAIYLLFCANKGFYAINATPDGEGSYWSAAEERYLKFRLKHIYTHDFIEWTINRIKKIKSHKRMILVDCGGCRTPQTEAIIENCEMVALIYNEAEAQQIFKWEDWIKELKKPCICKIETAKDADSEVKLIQGIGKEFKIIFNGGKEQHEKLKYQLKTSALMTIFKERLDY